ncbi:MAG TPA: NTP pyrophosphohydrolase [Candidatus Omnitrophica bacterium]|nr:NTP pyrophosphohydrolase [Candidatus Omnitrophota bacterium]HBG64408.1 NTP pyrophosphohydrolase [Candidatus Omnitrophota bacterium]HCD39321.1 NTP pyrophosphohydrolase [Candidatus Omnitrophota bacterium]
MPERITLQEIKERISRFISKRNWEQYHSPKNISMSIAIEAAELMEHFQWLSPEESRDLLGNAAGRAEIEDELADIAIYVLDFCNLFSIDIEKIIARKLGKTAKKYPVRLVKGKAHKYTYYQKLKRKSKA